MPEPIKIKDKSEEWYIKNTLPVMKKAFQAGLNEREVGVLLGYLGKNPKKSLARIEKECKNPAEAIVLALKLANSHLIARLYQVAVAEKPEIGAVKLLVKNQLPELFKEEKINSKVFTPSIDETSDLKDFIGELQNNGQKTE